MRPGESRLDVGDEVGLSPVSDAPGGVAPDRDARNATNAPSRNTQHCIALPADEAALNLLRPNAFGAPATTQHLPKLPRLRRPGTFGAVAF